MSVHSAALSVVPMVCNALVVVNGSILLWHLLGGDKPGIAKYALRIAACMYVSGWAFFAEGDYFFAFFEAFVGSIYLIIWWHSGGGDNTKRRLKKFKEKFVGQRRTAPQTA